jgi:uncharacterized Tic20 family protein
VSGSRAGFVWFFVAFVLLLAAGGAIGIAALSFLSSLGLLYLSIGLSVGAIVCALVALARHAKAAGA